MVAVVVADALLDRGEALGLALPEAVLRIFVDQPQRPGKESTAPIRRRDGGKLAILPALGEGLLVGGNLFEIRQQHAILLARAGENPGKLGEQLRLAGTPGLRKNRRHPKCQHGKK